MTRDDCPKNLNLSEDKSNAAKDTVDETIGLLVGRIESAVTERYRLSRRHGIEERHQVIAAAQLDPLDGVPVDGDLGLELGNELVFALGPLAADEEVGPVIFGNF